MAKVYDANEVKVSSYIDSMRPREEMRKDLDMGYSRNKNVYELFEIRPFWGKPNEYQKIPFAKIKYVRTQKKWKLYWRRASGKWETYRPFPESSNIDDIINCIRADEYGCFFG